MAHLTLTCFGPFRVALDGRPLATLRSNRLQALLAYLVLEAQRAHAREALAALFWPDEPGDAAKQNLRQALYQLRQLLGEPAQAPIPATPFLVIARDTVQFNPAGDYALDVVTFQRHLESGRLEEAIHLYQDDLLTGLNSDSERFEEWLLLTRETWHIRVLDTLDHVTRQALARGDAAQAQRYARRQLVLEPWREQAHRQLMEALVVAGERGTALAQYETCRRILADELGVEPDDETEALAERIRAVKRDKQRRNEGSRSNDLFPSSLPTHSIAAAPTQDWGESPDSMVFYGREPELSLLERWVTSEGCRLVLVQGMGGMGKTTLAAYAARQNASQFDIVIWRSLLSAPPLDDMLHAWLHLLSEYQVALPEKRDAQLALLFTYLRRRRCLLILDNAESIIHAHRYRVGYEEYGQLFQRIGESQHQSCLILTSREQFPEVARLERSTPLVQTLLLSGLQVDAAQAILQTQGIVGATGAARLLVQRYSGNPLALLLIAETITTLFDGDIAAFLAAGTPIFGDIRALLDQQLARLSPLEHAILLWLAIAREPVSVGELSTYFVSPVPRSALIEALNSLYRHSLLHKTVLERGESLDHTAGVSGFTVQNVVIEYLTDYLISEVCRDVETTTPELLYSHALLRAGAKAYVRESQARLIVQSVVDALRTRLGSAGFEAAVARLLALLRAEADQRPSYAAGNLLNLLLQARADLAQFDFSQLAVWQPYLQGANLRGVNFAHADLSGAVLTDTFSSITALGFSPDGRMIVGGTADGDIRLWRVADGRVCGVLQGHTNQVWSIVFRPPREGQAWMLASCSDDMLIHLWELEIESSEDVVYGRVLHTLRGHAEGVWHLSFSPDGCTLASAGADHTVRLWDVASGELRCTLAHYQQGVRSVAFSPNGALLATACEDTTVGVWDVHTAQLLTQLEGHTGMVWCVAFSPDGQWIASGSEDRTVRLWQQSGDTATFAPPSEAPAVLHGHTQRVSDITFSPDGARLASSSNDQTVRVWDMARGQVSAALHGHSNVVNCVAFHPGGAMIASGGADQAVRLWDAQSGQMLRSLQGHAHGVMGVAFAPDGHRLACACQDNTVLLVDMHTRTFVAALVGHTEEVKAVAFSPDGTLLASCSADQTIRIWEASSGALQRVLVGHRALVRSVTFSADSALLISGSSDRTVRVWDAQTGELRRVLSSQRASTWSVAGSPDGSLVAAGCTDDAVYMWDMQQPPDRTGEPIALHSHTTWVTSVAFSPDGTLLASGSGDHSVRVWRVYTGELVATLSGHEDWVYGVAFSHTSDGTLLLASCGADRSVRVWDVHAKQLLCCLRGHGNAVRSVAFHPTTLTLASGSIDGTIKWWDVRTGTCIETLRAPRPYESMNITGITGITESQKAILRALGAVEQ